MKFVAFATVCALLSVSCTKSYRGDVVLNNESDSISYSLGVFVGTTLTQQMKRMPFEGVDSIKLAQAFLDAKIIGDYEQLVKDQLFGDEEINTDAFKYGLAHQFILGKTKIEVQVAELICNKRAAQIQKKKDIERAAKATENAQKGAEYMAANLNNEGVIAHPSGVQYKVLATGNGAKPKETDRVKVNYEGRLIDGTVFDSSYERNQPAEFGVKQVIPGWTLILQEMCEGDKWQVVIPDSLAYGVRGGGDKIGPNETLIFDVELLEVIKDDKK